MEYSDHSNAQAGDILEPSDIYDGIVITFHLEPEYDIPSMEFFYSRHCWGVYKAPSLLPLSTSYSTGAIFGCAVNVAEVDRFLTSLKPIGREINSMGRCEADEPDFHGSRLALNEEGEALVEEMHARMEEFVESGDWINHDITVVDCLEHWSADMVKDLVTPEMDEDEALEILEKAQNDAQTANYRIIGPVDAVLNADWS